MRHVSTLATIAACLCASVVASAAGPSAPAFVDPLDAPTMIDAQRHAAIVAKALSCGMTRAEDEAPWTTLARTQRWVRRARPSGL